MRALLIAFAAIAAVFVALVFATGSAGGNGNHCDRIPEEAKQCLTPTPTSIATSTPLPTLIPSSKPTPTPMPRVVSETTPTPMPIAPVSTFISETPSALPSTGGEGPIGLPSAGVGPGHDDRGFDWNLLAGVVVVGLLGLVLGIVVSIFVIYFHKD